MARLRKPARERSFSFPESAIDRFLSAHLSNSQYNKVVWTVYPVLWKAAARLRGTAPDSDTLGDEWGTGTWVDQIVDEYIRPYLTPESVAGEIGVGGGRIAAKVVQDVGEFYCFDVSKRMLSKARETLRDYDHVRYVHLPRPECPAELEGRLDFVYAFDVFVHLDLHAMWSYFEAMSKLLGPGGRALVHVANLEAPLGWEKFSQQKAFSVGGLYFVSPEIVAILADHAGFQRLKESSPDPRNDYLGRDYLAVLEKKA